MEKERLSGSCSGVDDGKPERRILEQSPVIEQLWPVFSQSFNMPLNYFEPGGKNQTQASPVQIFKGFLIPKAPKR